MIHRAHPEDDLHMAVAQFLDLALPHDAAWTTVEHGGKRSKRESGRLKAKGVKPGWPDILIVYGQRAYTIELKAPGGRLNKNQKIRHPIIRNAGVPVAVCRRIEEVEGTLRGWGLPLKATTGVPRGQGEAA